MLIYFSLVLFGWINIYAATFDEEVATSIFNITQNSGKQLIWIGTSLLLILAILIIDFRFYESVAYIVYGISMLLLLMVLLLGREVSGATSWFELGPFRLQPSEFAKFCTVLAMAKFIGGPQKDLAKLKNQAITLLILGTPALLILLQPDAGSAMVYISLILVAYREGFSPIPLYLGLAAVLLFVLTLLIANYIIFLIVAIIILALLFVGIYLKSLKKVLLIVIATVSIIFYITSVDFIMNNVLKPHQQKRLISLINPNSDPLGYGWNVTQSKIAIGSGGFAGKGFLEGTQTKFDFVPEQSTDFIFCTVGEEYGWVGSMVVIVLFSALLFRLLSLAERQKSKFSRVYGYGVVSIIFFHFTVNIAMTIGLFPVIGIPLPFISYGGSSLWAFTILLFIFLKMDAHRMQLLERW